MKRTTALLVFAQFVHTGAKLILFVFLTQFGGFSVAGSYTYALAIITPTFILFGFSLRQIFVTSPTDVYFKDFLLLRSIFGATAIVVVLLIATAIRPEALGLFATMALYRFVESLVDLRIAFFQRSRRVDLMALSTFLLALSTTGVVAFAFLLSANLILSVFIGSVSGFILFLIFPLFSPTTKMKQAKPSFSFHAAFQISKNGLFLSVSSFLVSLGSGLPVLILGSLHSDSAVGVYSSIYYLSSISNILFSAVSQAELRVFAELAAARKYNSFVRRARRYSWSLSGVGIVAVIPMYFFGTDVFSLVFGEDFSDYRTPLMIVVFTICLAPFSFFLDVQLVSLQRFSTQTAISVITVAFTAICGLVLIPLLSIVGATLTLLLTMFVRNVVKSLVVHRIMSQIDVPDSR